MKYTFNKFQIQLVVKQNPSFQNKLKSSSALSNHLSSKNRNIKTAHSYSRNPELFNEISKQIVDNQIKFIKESQSKITRSQSLKFEIKNRYKNWSNRSQVAASLKQKQYKDFQQKCMNLLSKKKPQSQYRQQKRVQFGLANKQNSLFGHSNENVFEQSPVERMMSNIIQKFKTSSKQKNLIRKDSTKNQKFNNNLKQEQFITISNQFPLHQSQSFRYGQGVGKNFHAVKSAELRRGSCQKNNQQINPKCIDQEEQIGSKFLENSWKDKPDVTGIRVNKKINSQGYPLFNPIICTSLALSSPSREMKRNLLAFQHIKLIPCTKITQSQLSIYPKRKKIHLNKPTIVKKFMKFTKNTSDEQYNKKIKAYLDFLYKVNFSNFIYISLQLTSLDQVINNEINKKYKVYVGLGNNSLLIKSLLKRREWLQFTDNINDQGIQFYWTQNKINQVHQKQENSHNYKQQKDLQKAGQRKKPSSKITSENKQHNFKILTDYFCEQVQNYIFQDGYEIPFEKQYSVNIVSNHIPNNYVIGSKKNLLKILHSYYTNVAQKDPFSIIPMTYHIKSTQDSQFKRFTKQNSSQPAKLWIVKPGQNTNRGNGIRLAKFSKVQNLIKQKTRHPNGNIMTYVLQSYISKPFLYNGRKFDIRHYMLITSVNGILKMYWYRDGYIRTSSELYDVQDPDNEFVHLTNDAIQQKSQTYGRYEEANKLSYSEFQRYLDYSFPGRGYNFDSIVKEMKSIIGDVAKASYLNLDKDRKRDNFQLFGFDFMIDKDFKPYLIQINFNPCLVVNCSTLSRLIPPLIESTLRIGLDPLFPPKSHLPVSKRNTLSQNYLRNLRYELIFDETTLETDIYNKVEVEDSEEEEEYCDNGKELPDNITF